MHLEFSLLWPSLPPWLVLLAVISAGIDAAASGARGREGLQHLEGGREREADGDEAEQQPAAAEHRQAADLAHGESRGHLILALTPSIRPSLTATP